MCMLTYSYIRYMHIFFFLILSQYQYVTWALCIARHLLPFIVLNTINKYNQKYRYKSTGLLFTFEIVHCTTSDILKVNKNYTAQ